MIFSRKSEHALRALVHLALSGQVCDAGTISRAQQAPHHFMAKVLQELKAKGFVRSVRGAGGGFRLAREPETIHLMDIIYAMDGDQLFRGCVYGFADCAESNPCPLHEGWKTIRTQFDAYLREHTLADLVQKEHAKTSILT